MFRNWFLVSILVLMGLTVALQSIPTGPPTSGPIVFDGTDPNGGDGGDDDDDPGGPGL